MLKEFVVPFSELRTVAIECAGEKGCHTVVVLDLEGQLNITRCPACGVDFDGVRDNVVQLSRLYFELKKGKRIFW